MDLLVTLLIWVIGTYLGAALLGLIGRATDWWGRRFATLVAVAVALLLIWVLVYSDPEHATDFGSVARNGSLLIVKVVAMIGAIVAGVGAAKKLPPP